MKPLHFLLLLTCSFIILYQNPCLAQDPILKYCPPEAVNFTSGSKFESNLKNLLLPSLFSNGSRKGYFNTSSGEKPDTVYGLAQCRGDISMKDCNSCLNNISRFQIIKDCPNKKDAFMGYENCLLRYSDVDFFTKAEYDQPVGWLSWSGENASDQAGFNPQVEDLMNKLASSASSKPTKFDSVSISNVYGLVQCTRDLSDTDCYKCLQKRISNIDSCCSRTRGATVMSKSCAIRYDSGPFVQLPPPPTSLPPPPSKNVGVIVGPIVAGAAVMLLLCVYCLIKRRRRKSIKPELIGGSDIISPESLQYDFVTIKDATNNFSDANKLGEGGFGAVYKGELLNEEIAVKRLSSTSGQGTQEFKNEVVILHKLHHRNLVRLLGFCLEGGEKILIYEYVPNRSLDKYLFDPSRKADLDWQTRYKIIGGIARGLLYLHEDSRHRIIHRDLKAGNILLDEEMNAKIADFGMAKLFKVDQTQFTNRIAGTFGYMAPEYAVNGQFSVKSDVYSFGVIVLEIVVGQMITSFNKSSADKDLMSYAWKHWNKGNVHELLDPFLRDCFSQTEVMRCVHIALLCVQENVSKRPAMASIVLMLSCHSFALEVPSPPAFFVPSGEEANIFHLGEAGTNLSEQATNNEVTITEFEPR